MLERPHRFSSRRLAAALATCAFGVGVFAPTRAEGHFSLDAPPSWMSQDAFGAPEKMGPCGDEGGGTASGIVTAFQSGSMITVTINEIIFHPGHYRIALAVNGRGDLPPEPAVTPGVQACGTAAIESPPVFPVLADDVFNHTAQFTSPQSIQIMLPANVTCTHCTLQVIEFMSDHGLNVPGGCFYHHCADISLQTGPVPDAGNPPPDAGGTEPDASSTMPDASSGGRDATVTDGPSGPPSVDAAGGLPDGASTPAAATPQASSGCSVALRPANASSGLLGSALMGLLGLALLGRRRRNRGAL